VLLGLLLAPATASAQFGDIRHVTDGTAYTLERGELTVGVFSPIQYGIVDELELALHPILYLLLTPNVALKWKVYDGPVAISLSATYLQTFLDTSVLPGVFSVFPTLTAPLGGRVSLSVQGGYLLDLAPLVHGALLAAGIAVLATSSDLLRAQVQEEWYRDGRSWVRPTALVTWEHAWYQIRLRLGVAVGQFPLQVGPATADVKQLPVFPIVDVWWQL
jgi:hypothetical protein